MEDIMNTEKVTQTTDQITAAYALNLWTVSISQIIDYNDVNVLKQECAEAIEEIIQK